MLKYLLERLKERSTWLGLIGIATACGATLEVGLAEHIISAGMALAGLIGVVTKDSKNGHDAL